MASLLCPQYGGAVSIKYIKDVLSLRIKSTILLCPQPHIHVNNDNEKTKPYRLDKD